MFGEEAASRLLQKWNSSFKDKVVREAKNLKGTSLLRRHLKSALNEGSDATDDPGTSSKSNKISRIEKDFIDYFPLKSVCMKMYYLMFNINNVLVSNTHVL